jgi:DNA-binding transcriptional regulator YdaS (Cro superfamily)
MDVVKYIYQRRKKEALRAIARDLGVSAPYLNDLLARKRNAGPKILAAIESKRGK